MPIAKVTQDYREKLNRKLVMERDLRLVLSDWLWHCCLFQSLEERHAGFMARKMFSGHAGKCSSGHMAWLWKSAKVAEIRAVGNSKERLLGMDVYNEGN